MMPVISSRFGSIPELVEHDTNGLIFGTGNAVSEATDGDATADIARARRTRLRKVVADLSVDN